LSYRITRARRWPTKSALLLVLAFVPGTMEQAEAAAVDLYAQSAAALLNRSFASQRIEYLLLDLHSGQTVAERWTHAEDPVPVGSLLKPFVALAYARLHPKRPAASLDQFPAIRCRGKIDGCWRPGGHGSITLQRAVAESCNAYFLSLARELVDGDGAAALRDTTIAYRLPMPPRTAAGSGDFNLSRALVGLTPEWRVPPGDLARAYALMASDSQDSVVVRVLAGMKMATTSGGTAARIGTHPGGVLAKTGTAPCVPDLDQHHNLCLANNDGLVVALTPAEEPRLLLLVRERGTTGAHAAEVAGRMFALLEDANAPTH
jgi:hypothetical protein